VLAGVWSRVDGLRSLKDPGLICVKTKDVDLQVAAKQKPRIAPERRVEVNTYNPISNKKP
jgi:hypothetical protein